ncbi:MAG: peroxiredoxin, partial [Ignavibacteriota bacterium]
LYLLIALLFTMTDVSLQVGQDAPKFTAQSTDGSMISLDQFKGKQNVVLYFYPEDMTGGCTAEACAFRDDKSKFDELHTAILGVSMDPIEMHRQFTEKDHLNFPLLVDTSGTICKAYGVPTSEDRYPKRWTFLIDKNGKIAKIYQQVHPREHSAELQKDVEALPK